MNELTKELSLIRADYLSRIKALQEQTVKLVEEGIQEECRAIEKYMEMYRPSHLNPNGFDIDTVEGATAYLESEGVDVEEYVKRGMAELLKNVYRK